MVNLLYNSLTVDYFHLRRKYPVLFSISIGVIVSIDTHYKLFLIMGNKGMRYSAFF